VRLLLVPFLLLGLGRSPQEPCAQGGYVVAVTAVGAPSIDSAYLAAFARSAAYRWQVPSRQRADYSNWRRVRRRTLPPEPRWADDWRPEGPHRAQLILTVYRNGKLRATDPDSVSGDRAFDRSLRSIANDPMPGAPPIPAFPAAVSGDSLVVRLYFGYDSVPESHGSIRFAAEQTPVRLTSAPLSVTAPRGPGTPPSGSRGAVFKYDVTELGEILPASVEVLESSDHDYEVAVRDNLLRQHFQPATQNCRPVGMSVVQRFGF
jgi:hypothetical protein